MSSSQTHVMSPAMIMKQPLLIRRKNSEAEDTQDDVNALIDDLRELSSSTSTATPLPNTNHKRKQSDRLDLGDLDSLNIGKAPDGKVNTTYSSLSPSSLSLEPGSALDSLDEDGVYPRAQGWKNPLSISSSQLTVLFIVLATLTLTTRHSIISSRYKSNNMAPIDEGSEEISTEPMEAHFHEDWVELYNSPDRMPDNMKSSGPFHVDPKNLGGLHMFENVCVTNNIDAPKPPESDTSMRGLIYFTNKEQSPKRCVPCSKSQMREEQRKGDGWNKCGMSGLHAMYAKSVTDYNRCMKDTENHKSIIRSKQNQSPSNVKKIHYFQEPTFLLQFDGHDREKSLFDMLLTYLPYWDSFRKDSSFPFDSVISHSVEHCLTHSKNWLCEILHQMGALGYSRQLPWERDDNTLYCFKSMYYNQLGYQRNLEHDGLSKEVMDAFRDELFKNLALPGPRDMSEIYKKDAKLGLKRPINIALYDGKTVWKDLYKLVTNVQSMKKYHNIQFNYIDDLDGPVAEQATAFNLADAVVMVSGDHLANAIFAVDGTSFVEVGCSSQSLIGNSYFMALLSGTHQSVTGCSESQAEDEVCVTCTTKSSFTMTEKHFQSLIDDIMKRHEDKISFQRDSM